MELFEMTIDQLLKKRDYHKDLIDLHSQPYGLAQYREYHEKMVEAVEAEIKKRIEVKDEKKG